MSRSSSSPRRRICWPSASFMCSYRIWSRSMLADTLYRVPRKSGLHVLQRRGSGGATELTSSRLRLGANERATYRNPTEETVMVLQEGTGVVEADGQRWPVSRRGVFTERATALYVPVGVEVNVEAQSPF